MTNRYKVCALIWTYNPEAQLLQRVVEATLKNVDYVFIVDNGSQNRGVIESLKSENVEIIHLPLNLGVEALNIGFDIITSRNLCEWILILDDDSIVVQANAVKEVLSKYESLPEELKRKIAVISLSDLESVPLTLKNKLSSAPSEALIVHYDAIIFSGALIRAEVISKHCLRIEKEFFMYHADTEFFTRVRRHGYLTVIYTKRLLQHRLGLPLNKPINLGFYEIKSTIKPNRFYYITRNATYLLVRRRISPLQWLFSILRFAIPLILQDFRTTMKVFLLGFIDGVMGMLGIYQYLR